MLSKIGGCLLLVCPVLGGCQNKKLLAGSHQNKKKRAKEWAGLPNIIAGGGRILEIFAGGRSNEVVLLWCHG